MSSLVYKYKIIQHITKLFQMLKTDLIKQPEFKLKIYLREINV